MAIDMSLIQTFTDAEIVTLMRFAIAQNAAGQTIKYEGRTVVLPTLIEINAILQAFEDRVSVSEAGSMGIVSFNRAK